MKCPLPCPALFYPAAELHLNNTCAVSPALRQAGLALDCLHCVCVCAHALAPSLVAAPLRVPSHAEGLYKAALPRCACRVRFLQKDVWEGYQGGPADTVEVGIGLFASPLRAHAWRCA